MHVSAARLMALLDGEMEPAQAVRIRSHIAECPACASEYGRFAAEKQRFQPAHPGPPAPWSRVAKAMAALQAGGDGSASRERLLAELRRFLGGRIAARLEAVSDRKLLVEVETLLATFLGRQGAAAVLKDIARRPGAAPRTVEGRS